MYDFIAEAIAAYERTHELNQFNSKYDLFLQGKVKLTEQEVDDIVVFLRTLTDGYEPTATSR